MTIVRAISRIIFYWRRLNHRRAHVRLAACAVAAAVFSAPQLVSATNTTVRMVLATGVPPTTPFGTIDIQLFDSDAPLTVANFLRYAGNGCYSQFNTTFDYPVFGPQIVPAVSFIYGHSSIVPDGVSVIQGGYYAYSDLRNLTTGIKASIVNYTVCSTFPPVPNEFSPLHSNTTGSIAMAKVPNDPNSATSAWFINLADNSALLDDPNYNGDGGYTVFGTVVDMTAVNATANLPIVDASVPLFQCSSPCNLPITALREVPVNNYDATTGLDPGNLVSVVSIPNVISITTIPGYLATFTADVDMTFVGAFTLTSTTPITAESLLTTFTPPPNKAVQFNDGIFTFKITGTLGSTGRIVTLRNDDPTTVTNYYAYGPTADNTTPHWFDFTYDGTTGAEFVGNKILLHFVDGQRGDYDRDSTSITHLGAPVVVTPLPSSSSGGCTIAATPQQMTGNGDWVVTSLFLAFVALVRRRTRHDRIQRASRQEISDQDRSC